MKKIRIDSKLYKILERIAKEKLTSISDYVSFLVESNRKAGE